MQRHRLRKAFIVRAPLLALTFIMALPSARADSTASTEPIDALITRLGLVEAPTPVRERAGWAPPKLVLVRALAPELIAAMRTVAPGVKIVPASSEEQAITLAGQADAIIGFCSDAVLDAGKRVRWVQALAAGVEQCVQAHGLRERDILLTNMQRVAGPVMAEH